MTSVGRSQKACNACGSGGAHPPEFCIAILKSELEVTKVKIRWLFEALVARRASEPQHSREDHTCKECEVIAETIHFAKPVLEDRVSELERRIQEALVGLRLLEQTCPCGARPESPNTHPHVTNCLLDVVIRRLQGPEKKSEPWTDEQKRAAVGVLDDLQKKIGPKR